MVWNLIIIINKSKFVLLVKKGVRGSLIASNIIKKKDNVMRIKAQGSFSLFVVLFLREVLITSFVCYHLIKLINEFSLLFIQLIKQ